MRSYINLSDVIFANGDTPASKVLGFAVRVTDKFGKIYYLARDDRTHSSFDTNYPILVEDEPDIYKTKEEALEDWTKNYKYTYKPEVTDDCSVQIVQISVLVNPVESFSRIKDAEIVKMQREIDEREKEIEDLKRRIKEREDLE